MIRPALRGKETCPSRNALKGWPAFCLPPNMPKTSAPAPTAIRPIRKLMVANRSEIAIRIMRAATELGIRTVAVYAQEDRVCPHRFKADEAYELNKDKGPLGAYLDIDGIVALAKEKDVDAIPP